MKDKDKTKQSLTETKIKWEAAAEGGMTKVRCAVQNHNVLISEGLVSLLDTYRINFIKCQEYIETIQPQINQYLTFADNVNNFNKFLFGGLILISRKLFSVDLKKKVVRNQEIKIQQRKM